MSDGSMGLYQGNWESIQLPDDSSQSADVPFMQMERNPFIGKNHITMHFRCL